ncbi:MAG: phage terminase large subunit [Micropepsaceae bacterium]
MTTLGLDSLKGPLTPELMDAICRNDLYTFSVKAFPHVFPGPVFQRNWHHKLIARALADVLAGRIKRLLITLPPRHLKSYYASIVLPAFALGLDPTTNLLCVSYASELAAKHARDCRALMQSGFYRQMFPDTRLDPKRTIESDFNTTARGCRLATSIGGQITGRGGEIIIIDDPIKPVDAASPNMRQKVIDWSNNTIFSRLNDKKSGSIILVMQRLHDDDLAGHYLRTGDWTHINLPAIAQKLEVHLLGRGEFYRRDPGELLHPEFEPQYVLDGLRQQMGSANFAAQYLQEPVPSDSPLLKWSWFRNYDALPAAGSTTEIWQSWDTAVTGNDYSDYSACITVMVHEKRFYIRDVFRERLDYPSLRQKIVAMAGRYPNTRVLIEDKGSGSSLIPDLRRDGQVRPIAFKPEGDKISRLVSQTAVIERGDLLIPTQAPWLPDFRRELMQFPEANNDDQVDALSQFLIHMDSRVRNKAIVMDLDDFMGRFRYS